MARAQKNLLKGIRKKKTRVKIARHFDEKYLGPEPIWDPKAEVTEAKLAAAYGWYNYFYDLKTSVEFLFKYYPRDKREIKHLKHLSYTVFPPTLGWSCKMVEMGCKLPPYVHEYLNKKIDGLIAMSKEITKKEKMDRVGYIPTIQERIKEVISNNIAFIENEIDNFIKNKYTTDFDIYSWLQTNSLKRLHSTVIANYYRPLLAELKELHANKTPDLNEGYLHLSKKDIKAYKLFVEKIVTECDVWSQNQKTVRKVRQKKPMSIDKQVSKLKYMNEYTPLRLVSVSPTEIISCQQLWVYNTKYRILMVYNAIDSGGLKVKGSTILNFDEKSSFGKKLRKPENQLPKVIKGGKLVLRSFMAKINSKESTVTGRINDQTILVRVVK
jgi:hypothetical protein